MSLKRLSKDQMREINDAQPSDAKYGDVFIALARKVEDERDKEWIKWSKEHCPHAGPPGDDPTQEKMYCVACWRDRQEEVGNE